MKISIITLFYFKEKETLKPELKESPDSQLNENGAKSEEATNPSQSEVKFYFLSQCENIMPFHLDIELLVVLAEKILIF